MIERWYQQAVIYCVDVDTFQDSNGDGIGDLPGLISRLDYLARLGVTCLWLNPIHPSPGRDDGYDVADFYGVHPRLGSLGDFVDLVHQCQNRGLRLILDLVVNHTSDQHPWFQSARRSPDSPYRDFYLWSPTEPPDAGDGAVFPGEQHGTWSYDKQAKAWYHHRFYDFQPDLNWANPLVRDEIGRVVAFWLQLGASGFRMDAAPFAIEEKHPDTSISRRDYTWLDDLHEHIAWRRGDGMVLAEANVDRDELPLFLGERGQRLQMLFNFFVNQRLFLSLARNSATPVAAAVMALPAIPRSCSWATFLRNHDEVDLSGLLPNEREECFAAFGPEESMRLYGRGIRRRLAPMLGGDRRRIEMAYVAQFTLPGTPVLRYGEEIGMGEDLTLADRNAIRTPMQWSDAPQGGFTTGDSAIRPVITDGDYGYRTVNVLAQRADPNSLLAWFERMLRTLRECPEFGSGRCTVLDAGHDQLLALRFDAASGSVLALTNFRAADRTARIGEQEGVGVAPFDLFANRGYPPPPADLSQLDVDGYGYRWIRFAGHFGAGEPIHR